MLVSQAMSTDFPLLDVLHQTRSLTWANAMYLIDNKSVVFSSEVVRAAPSRAMITHLPLLKNCQRLASAI
jgi:hypothetical protein